MADPSSFEQRQADVVLRPVEPDVSLTPDALLVLATAGVQAWRDWVAEHRPSE